MGSLPIREIGPESAVAPAGLGPPPQRRVDRPRGETLGIEITAPREHAGVILGVGVADRLQEPPIATGPAHVLRQTGATAVDD